MKIGDKVIISDRNPNHLGYGVSAYAGMEGIVSDIYDDNGFCLECNSSVLIVPMRNAYKQLKEGIWIWLNGELVFYKSKKTNVQKMPLNEVVKNWFQKLCLK